MNLSSDPTYSYRLCDYSLKKAKGSRKRKILKSYKVKRKKKKERVGSSHHHAQNISIKESYRKRRTRTCIE